MTSGKNIAKIKVVRASNDSCFIFIRSFPRPYLDPLTAIAQSQVLVISSSPPLITHPVNPLAHFCHPFFHYLHFGKVSKHPGAKVHTVTPFEHFTPGGNSAMSVVFTELSWTAIEAKRGTPGVVANRRSGSCSNSMTHRQCLREMSECEFKNITWNIERNKG